MNDDILDHVSLTPGVLSRWSRLCKQAVAVGLIPAPNAVEQATLEGSRLVIWLALADGTKLAMDVAPGDWTWAN